jgi:hypothetical protein
MDWYTYTSQIMSHSAIQLQKGLSLLELQWPYGSEEQYKAALEKAFWPYGLRCPRCHHYPKSCPPCLSDLPGGPTMIDAIALRPRAAG